jgi:hypothetical protein
MLRLLRTRPEWSRFLEMPINKAQRQQLILGWCGISITWLASVVLEILLLGSGAILAIGVTTTVAAVVGVFVTRKVTTPHRRASITVGDLRGRRLQRR